MNTTFETLNDLLHRHAGERPTTTHSEEEIIKAEVKDIPLQFSRAYLAQASKKVISGTVQYSQAATSLLLNRVYEFNQETPTPFYQFIENSLCGFIRLLFKYFPAHFDFSLPMPEPIWQPIKKDFSASLTQLQTQGLAPGLSLLISQELITSCKDRAPDYVIGYYWKELSEHLQLLQTHDKELGNTVVETLVSCNFNTGKFILYVIEWTNGGLDPDESAVNYWANVLKLVNRIPITPNMCLHKSLEPCKQSLILSITNELFASERMLPYADAGNKFLTAMSVGQLALFIRLLVESDIIQTNNIQELVRFFGKHFKTQKTAQISVESLRKRYYHIDKASVTIVKNYLGEMMNQLKIVG